MGIAADFIVLLVAGLVLGMVAQKFRQPLILGYIAAGVLLGPYTGGLTVDDPHDIELLAEIGVALLLFTLGLEFSLSDLKPVRKVALIGTPLQILFAGLLGWGIGDWLGWPWLQSLWFGAIISLSSTMVVLKTLEAKGLMGTLSSRVMIGMLLFQDLAIVPMLVILPKIGAAESGVGELIFAGVKAAVFLFLMIYGGRKLMPRLLRSISLRGSRELFLLAIAVIGLGIGYATYLFGLSFTFGAFVAGLVLSESDYGHQALSDMLPLRDIFGLLFFATVGMMLDPSFLAANLGTVLLLALLVIAGKGLILAVVSRAFGYVNIVPIAVGLGMFQIGELSFLLIRAGRDAGAFTADASSMFLTVSVATMIATPFLSELAAPIYRLRKRMFKQEAYQTGNLPVAGLSGHVIIAGGGRNGRFVANLLAKNNLPFVVVENSHQAMETVRERGWPVIFGDASQENVLEAADIHKARLLILTAPAITIAQVIVQRALALNPDLKIVARAEGMEQLAELRRLGVYEVVQPLLEAGLEFGRQALLQMNLSPDEIQTFIDSIHREGYAQMRENGDERKELLAMSRCSQLLSFKWVKLPPDSPVIGKTIGELGIRKRTGATVIGIMRNGHLLSTPGIDSRFEQDDWVAILGGTEQIAAFRELAGSNFEGHEAEPEPA